MVFGMILQVIQVLGVIKLESNIVLSSSLIINKKITVDMALYTISNTQDIWNIKNKKWSLISVVEGGDLTIQNGNLIAKDGDCYAIDVRDGAHLTIESGKYIGNVHCIYALEGKVTINGGEFDIQQLSEITHDSRYTLNCLDANYKNGSAKFVVRGGSFANYNPEGRTSEYPTAKFLAEGYEVVSVELNGDVWYTVVLAD